jgi:HAD superfamily hydrolase (TIGR01549 family)
MEYNSIIFDMDGVILNSFTESEEWKYEAVKSSIEELGASPEKIPKEDMDKILGDKGYGECIKACNKHGLNPRKAWKLVAEKTTLARIEKIKKGDFKLYEGVLETLKILRENEVKTALISNAPEEAVEATIQEFNLAKYFKFYRGIRNFEDLRERKPHPNHLEIAKAELKSNPYLYVGDSKSDIEAANNAKIASMWVHSRENNITDDPDYEVNTISELNQKLID